jgi:hypothetical protein
MEKLKIQLEKTHGKAEGKTSFEGRQLDEGK